MSDGKWKHEAQAVMPVEFQPCPECREFAVHDSCRAANLRWKQQELPLREINPVKRQIWSHGK